MDPNALPPGQQCLAPKPSYTCSHCQAVVWDEPSTHTYPFCVECNHHVCDACAVALAQTGKCKPFKQLLSEARERATLT